jgi:purine-cytosine permease-like protein
MVAVLPSASSQYFIFPFAVSWINCAADYNVKMPVNTARWKIFITSYVGNC